jgi:glucose/arabinose dehydrogenase
MRGQHRFARPTALSLAGLLGIMSLTGCGASAKYSLNAGVGSTPALPKPDPSLIPVINDGVAEVSTPFIEHLTSPFGMTLIGDALYVADTDAILRFTYRAGETKITDAGVTLVELPAGRRNHHWTRNIVASPEGSKLYVAIGSNSNVAENGLDEELDRAMIWEVDPTTGADRVFASGLRNPVGMAWQHGAL